jgi:hypothetical protein
LAASVGASPIVVRSILRRHPAFVGPAWRQSHGAAVVAVGHLLAGTIDRLLLSSSLSLFHAKPFGSHWDLDPHWSSVRLRVEHFGHHFRRFEKLEQIVHHPTVRRYVRPCWENPAHGLNCSACEKCVRTMLAIACCGDPRSFSAFDHGVALAERIDNLPKIYTPELLPIWEDFLDCDLPADCLRAAERLILRSRASVYRKNLRWKARAMLRWWLAGEPVTYA